MEAGLIDSIGKLSIEVVAILTLAYVVWTQGKNHTKMSNSFEELSKAILKRLDHDEASAALLKKEINNLELIVKSQPRCDLKLKKKQLV